MSYVSLLKNIPEIISQPAGIAAIASLGIHGAIAFILPLMPVDSKDNQAPSPKTVGLVELSQAEQNRLPQTGPPKVALQPQNLQPQVPLPNLAATQPTPPLPPLPSASSTQLILPPIPKSPNNFSISSVPKGQSLRIIPRKELQIVPSSNPKTNSFPVENRVGLGASKPLVSSNVPYNVPPVQPGKIPEDLLNTTPPPITSDTTPDATEGITTPQIMEPGAEASNVTENRQLVTPIAPPQAGDNNIALAEQNFQQSPPKLPELRSTATPVALRKITTLGDQFAKVKLQYPNIETKLPVSGTINALAGQEGKVEGALVVDSEGKVESIDYLDNSVSSDTKIAVNEYLREYLQNNPTRANGKPKYYPFTLALRSNSSNPRTIRELLPSPQTNQTQASDDAQRSLIQRLRSPKLNPQPSPEPQANSRDLRLPKVNPQPSSEPQANSRDLRSPQVNPQPSKKLRGNISRGLPLPQVSSQPPKEQLRNISQGLPLLEVKPQPPTETQESFSQRLRSSEVNPQQFRRKQPVAAPQTNQQQIARLQQIVKQPTPAPQANQQQIAQQEVSSNQPSSSVEPSKKLLQQLRELREKRQSSNQEQ